MREAAARLVRPQGWPPPRRPATGPAGSGCRGARERGWRRDDAAGGRERGEEGGRVEDRRKIQGRDDGEEARSSGDGDGIAGEKKQQNPPRFKAMGKKRLHVYSQKANKAVA